MIDKKALWEAVKLPLRVLFLAILPFIVTYFSNLPYSWAGYATTILVALDKYLHEVWKDRGNIKAKGIAPF